MRRLSDKKCLLFTENSIKGLPLALNVPLCVFQQRIEALFCFFVEQYLQFRRQQGRVNREHLVAGVFYRQQSRVDSAQRPPVGIEIRHIQDPLHGFCIAGHHDILNAYAPQFVYLVLNERHAAKSFALSRSMRELRPPARTMADTCFLLVPVPPEICRESVRIFAAGAISRLVNSPGSQQSARRIKR